LAEVISQHRVIVKCEPAGRLPAYADDEMHDQSLTNSVYWLRG